MSEPVLLTLRQKSLEPPPLPARASCKAPDLPERTHRQSKSMSEVISEFEQRFRFHNQDELPPAEPISGCRKTYPSDHVTRKSPRERPSQPPPRPPRSR